MEMFRLKHLNFTTQTGNTASITIPINSIGTYYTISEGIDSGTSTPFITTQSNTTFVSTALAKPNLTIRNPILDQGQVLNLFYSEYNGTLPYTYNVLIYNNTSNQPETFVSDNLFSHVFNLSTRMPQNGIYYAKVIVNDSASPPESKTSSDSSNIIVNKRPEIKLTPSSISTSNGGTETITINVYNGTGPFNVELLNASSNKEIGSNLTIPSEGSNSLSFTVLSPRGGIIDLKAIAIDQGTTIPYLFNSSKTEIDINPIYQTPSTFISNASSVGRWVSYNSNTNSISMSIPSSRPSRLGNIYTLFSTDPSLPLSSLNSESFNIISNNSQNIIGFSGSSGTYVGED